MERYLYEIRPKTRIVIPGKQPIVRPQSLQLTKEEVKFYMTKAAVWRRFDSMTLIPVTGENLNRLHTKTYNPNAEAPQQKPTIFTNLKPGSERGKVVVPSGGNNANPDNSGDSSNDQKLLTSGDDTLSGDDSSNDSGLGEPETPEDQTPDTTSVDDPIDASNGDTAPAQTGENTEEQEKTEELKEEKSSEDNDSSKNNGSNKKQNGGKK